MARTSENDPLKDFQKGFLLASTNSELSLGEIAKKLGVSAATISSWRSGAKRPHSSRLQDIADVCGVTLDELLNPTAQSLAATTRDRNVETWFPNLSDVLFLKTIDDAIAADATPLFLPGDILTVNRDAAPKDGDLWLVNHQGQWLIRKFLLSDPVRLEPVGISPGEALSFTIPVRADASNMPVNLLGRIVSVRREF